MLVKMMVIKLLLSGGFSLCKYCHLFTKKLRKHKMWLVHMIFVFRFHILRMTLNLFLPLQNQVFRCKWICSCFQQVSSEQCHKCCMFVGLEFCRWYLPIVFWKVHLWKLLINKLIFQIDILLPLEFQFSWLQFQNHSTILAITSKVLMTSKNLSFIVKVLLNTLARGQQSSWVEKADVGNTASMLLPVPGFYLYFYLFILLFLFVLPCYIWKRSPRLGCGSTCENRFCSQILWTLHLVVILVSSSAVPFDSVARLSACVLPHFGLQDFYAFKKYSSEGGFACFDCATECMLIIRTRKLFAWNIFVFLYPCPEIAELWKPAVWTK